MLSRWGNCSQWDFFLGPWSCPTGFTHPTPRPRSLRMGGKCCFLVQRGPPRALKRDTAFLQFHNKLGNKPRLPDFVADLPQAPNGQLLNIYTEISDSRCIKVISSGWSQSQDERLGEQLIVQEQHWETEPPWPRKEEARSGPGSASHGLCHLDSLSLCQFTQP